MLFSHLLGNPAAKEQITTLLAKKLLPPVLLFTGPKGVGKALFARALAEKLLATSKGQPPDLHFYAPSGKAGIHTVETIHELQSEIPLPPFEAPCKVFILEEAERMLPASSNALLKTLEEPPDDSYFLLITSQPEQILPTLLSRCTTIRFFPVPQVEIAKFVEKRFAISKEEAEIIGARAQGSVGKACQLVEKKESRLPELVEEIFEKRNPTAVQEIGEDEEEDLFEEIALYFRRKNPTKLLKLLPLLAKARTARERHVKLAAVVQYLLVELEEGGRPLLASILS
ncbi:MAG: ATP-binding protein [Chlamydiales bacterium]